MTIGIIISVLLIIAAVALGFNTSWVPGPLDAATALEEEVTKTASYDGATLDLGDGFAPQNAGQPFSAVIDTSALDLADADETYAFNVEQSADGASWEDISPAVSITAAGVKAIPVFVSARYVRVSLTAAGTTPSITYQAWLVPHH